MSPGGPPKFPANAAPSPDKKKVPVSKPEAQEPAPNRRQFLTGLAAIVAVGAKLGPIHIPAPDPLENTERKETFEALIGLFKEAEESFETGGRDPAKQFLPKLYNTLIGLNNWDKANWSPMTWNAGGFFTEAEFKELNRRRMILSNNIGILATDKDGKAYVRHDLNKIED